MTCPALSARSPPAARRSAVRCSTIHDWHNQPDPPLPHPVSAPNPYPTPASLILTDAQPVRGLVSEAQTARHSRQDSARLSFASAAVPRDPASEPQRTKLNKARR